MGPGADTCFPEAMGLPLSSVEPEQRALVENIITTWLGDLPAGLSDELRALYIGQLDQTHLQLTESATGQAAFMSLNGPRLWLEFLREPGVGTDEVHYHSVYRDKLLDYGPD